MEHAANEDDFPVDIGIRLQVVGNQLMEMTAKAGQWEAAAITQRNAVNKLAAMVAERDEKIAELEGQLAEKKGKKNG